MRNDAAQCLCTMPTMRCSQSDGVIAGRRPAFTLTELLVVVAIIAVTASLVIPSFQDDSRLRVMAASQILISDIELAQAMTIADPSRPVIVRFNAQKASYWLAYASMPSTPIDRPNSDEAYEVTFGEGRAAPASRVTMTLTDVPNEALQFDAFGALDGVTTTPAIRLQAQSRWIDLHVMPTTGTVVQMDDN